MDTKDPVTVTIPTPTALRPLLGLTVLVVEDSRFACEAMRLLCLRSGARIRRADSLRAARRHLQVYRPTVAIVDLGLPDGSGLDLIQDLATAAPRVEALLGISGDPNTRNGAIAAGADGFLCKPITGISVFQDAVLSALPLERHPRGPRIVTDEYVVPDRIAYKDDMAHIAEVLDNPPEESSLDYVAQFLSGVARSAEDTCMERAATALATKRARGHCATTEVAMIAGLIQERLTERIAI